MGSLLLLLTADSSLLKPHCSLYGCVVEKQGQHHFASLPCLRAKHSSLWHWGMDVLFASGTQAQHFPPAQPQENFGQVSWNLKASRACLHYSAKGAYAGSAMSNGWMMDESPNTSCMVNLQLAPDALEDPYCVTKTPANGIWRQWGIDQGKHWPQIEVENSCQDTIRHGEKQREEQCKEKRKKASS